MPVTFTFETNLTKFPCIDSGTFCIDAGYPEFKGGQDGQEAVLKGWVLYDEYEDFIAQMQPPSTLVGSSQIVQYGAQLPGFPYLRVTDWEASRFPKEAPGTELDPKNYFKHPLMYVSLTFRFVKQQGTSSSDPDRNPDPTPYLIHRLSVGGQVLSLDNQGLMWDDIRRKIGNDPANGSDPFFRYTSGGDTFTFEFCECAMSKRQKVGVTAGATEKINAVLQIPHVEHEITWPRVPKPPFSVIKTFVGCVNDREMKFQTGTIPAECLLFVGARVQQTVMSNGETSWELVYTFAERQAVAKDQAEPAGWNHFFRSQRPVPIFPYSTNSNPRTVYTTTDVPGPVSAHDTTVINSQDTWYYCPGLPGFYRLELNPGTNMDLCIDQVDDGSGGLVSIALKPGYVDQLAIFKKRNLNLLFRREGATS